MMYQSAKCQSIVPAGTEVFDFDVLDNDKYPARYQYRCATFDDEMKTK